MKNAAPRPGQEGESMPQTIHRGIKAMIDEANAEIDARLSERREVLP